MAPESGRVALARERLAENHYDTDAWQVILKEIQGRPNPDDYRPIYEDLVKYFPTSGRYWKMYIDHEMMFRNYDKVEKLFQRSLINVMSIDLWKTYLNYVKETKHSLPTYKEKMALAFDFALEKMGMDIASFSLYNDYVKFVKGVEAVGSYAENQRITAIRRVYQKGIVTPLTGIESLWNDYINFEKVTAAAAAFVLTTRRRS